MWVEFGSGAILSFRTELSTELYIFSLHYHKLIASNKQKCCFVVIMHQATLFSCFSDMHLWSSAGSTTEKTDPCSVTATPAPPAVLRGSFRDELQHILWHVRTRRSFSWTEQRRRAG